MPIKAIEKGADRSTPRPAEFSGLSWQLLEQAYEGASVGIIITDCRLPDNPIVYVNAFFETISGYTRDELLGKNCRFLQGRETEQPDLRILREAIHTGSACQVCLRNFRKDGSLYFNELSLSPLYDGEGCLTHFVGASKDVTAQVATERELKELLTEKEDRFSAYMKHAAECIWRIDFDPPVCLSDSEKDQIHQFFNHSIFAEANDAMSRIYGLEKGTDVIGQPLLNFLTPSDARNSKNAVDLIRNRFQINNVISHETTAEGIPHVQLNNITPIIRNGTVTAIWGTSLDVTELIQTQEKLEQSEKELLDQKAALEAKNIALKELIAQIELEKKDLKDRIMANVETVILPSLAKLELRGENKAQLEQHRQSLEALTSSFGRNISDNNIMLSPREIEVCTLVKNGLTNKEIAGLLHIALHTVEKHRRSARKKLGLNNTKTNLASYLGSL